MAIRVDMRVVELLSARLCHELISPVAAIGNGVELLSDDEPDFLQEAVSLVAESTRKAASRLQFYRFAFGFGGGGTLTGPPPHQLATEFFERTRIVCDYAESARALSLGWQKLACNLLVVGAEALPRGGRLVLTASDGGAQVEGEGGGPSPDARAALALTTPMPELTSRTIGAYFSGLLAEALGCKISVADIAPGHFRLSSAPAK